MTSLAFSSATETAYPRSASAISHSPQGASYPEIVPAVHIPLCGVPVLHISETRVPVRVADEVPSLVDALLVRVVVAVVRVDEVLVLADAVFEVDQPDLEGVQFPVVMPGGIVDVVRVVLKVGGRGHCERVSVRVCVSACLPLSLCLSANPAVVGITNGGSLYPTN